MRNIAHPPFYILAYSILSCLRRVCVEDDYIPKPDFFSKYEIQVTIHLMFTCNIPFFFSSQNTVLQSYFHPINIKYRRYIIKYGS